MTTDEPRPEDGPMSGDAAQRTPAEAPAPPSSPGSHRFDARDFEARAQSLGREAEAAAQRFAKNPTVGATVDIGARIWGVFLLAVGLWFLADVTLELPVPSIAWRDAWPLALVAVGLVVLARGALSRR